MRTGVNRPWQAQLPNGLWPWLGSQETWREQVSDTDAVTAAHDVPEEGAGKHVPLMGPPRRIPTLDVQEVNAGSRARPRARRGQDGPQSRKVRDRRTQALLTLAVSRFLYKEMKH